MKKLLDSWFTTGKEIKDMYEILEDMSESTFIKKVRTDNINIFTLLDATDEKVFGFLQSKDGPMNEQWAVKELQESHGADKNMLNETCEKSKLLVQIGDEIFFTSKESLNSLGLRADLAGKTILSDNQKVRFYRDALITAALSENPTYCNVVYRKRDETKKIFYFGSDRFNDIRQDSVIKQTITLLEKEMGEGKLKSFEISNFSSVIYIEFPEKAKDFKKVYGLKDEVVPGAWICTSDVGESSYIVNGTMRVNKAIVFVPGARYARQHTKNASVEKIIEALDKTIFPEYRTVPERLAELIMIDIPNPEDTIEKVAKKIGLSVIGQKAEKRIIDEMILGINPTLQYTAYDIAMMFLDAGIEAENNTSGTKDSISKLRSLFVQAVFFKY